MLTVRLKMILVTRRSKWTNKDLVKKHRYTKRMYNLTHPKSPYGTAEKSQHTIRS